VVNQPFVKFAYWGLVTNPFWCHYLYI